MQTDEKDIFLDLPPGGGKWYVLMFPSVVFVVTLAGVFAILRHRFPNGGMVSTSIILAVSLVLALVVAITVFQPAYQISSSRRRALFASGTEVGFREGADGFLIDLSGRHSGAVHADGKGLVIALGSGDLALRLEVENFVGSGALKRFEEAGLLSDEIGCCSGRSTVVHLDGSGERASAFVRRLLDLLWEQRDHNDRWKEKG
jgi:hypothetical protein